MSSRRDRIKQPICQHKPTGYIEAGDGKDPSSRHASTVVCDREACIEDAMDWAEITTLGLPTKHVRWKDLER